MGKIAILIGTAKMAVFTGYLSLNWVWHLAVEYLCLNYEPPLAGQPNQAASL
jgi:hypothetical protein